MPPKQKTEEPTITYVVTLRVHFDNDLYEKGEKIDLTPSQAAPLLALKVIAPVGKK